MKKQISLLEDLLKKYSYVLLYLSVFTFCLPKLVIAEEEWILDKELSSVSFEVPVLLVDNIKGKFNEIEGIIKINTETKNSKAIFSVNIQSIETNYKKYNDLILSSVFFNSKKYSKALLDTKQFKYTKEEGFILNVELIIKDKSKMLPLNVQVKYLTEDIIQVKTKLNFSRKDFNIGTGKWSNSAILKNKVEVKTNLFFFKN